MRASHLRQSGYEVEVELRLRWLEFYMLPQPAQDHINSQRLLPVEETERLLGEVFNGNLII